MRKGKRENKDNHRQTRKKQDSKHLTLKGPYLLFSREPIRRTCHTIRRSHFYRYFLGEKTYNHP